MYIFTNPTTTEYGIGNETILSDGGKPFAIENEQIAQSLLIRGIIKAVESEEKPLETIETAEAVADTGKKTVKK
jgi:hypothetical protein